MQAYLKQAYQMVEEGGSLHKQFKAAEAKLADMEKDQNQQLYLCGAVSTAVAAVGIGDSHPF